MALVVPWYVAALTAAGLLAIALHPAVALVSAYYVVLLAHELAHAFAAQRAGFIDLTVAFRLVRAATTGKASRPWTTSDFVVFYLAGPITGVVVSLLALAALLVSGAPWYMSVGLGAIALVHAENLLPLRKGSDGSKLKAVR